MNFEAFLEAPAFCGKGPLVAAGRPNELWQVSHLPLLYFKTVSAWRAAEALALLIEAMVAMIRPPRSFVAKRDRGVGLRCS